MRSSMVEILNDFQNRSIITRTRQDMVSLGYKILSLLKDMRTKKLVKGCFFTHYFNPPDLPLKDTSTLIENHFSFSEY